jgi:hypothetical protein
LLTPQWVGRFSCFECQRRATLLTELAGPYAWLIGGEYPNNQQRGYVFGIASALNFLFTWLGTFTAPFFINPAALNWNAQYGYIWFGSNMIMVVFTYFLLPETRDRTLEEIHEMFEAKLPARKFKGYKCTVVDIARVEKEAHEMDEVEHIEMKDKV